MTAAHRLGWATAREKTRLRKSFVEEKWSATYGVEVCRVQRFCSCIRGGDSLVAGGLAALAANFPVILSAALQRSRARAARPGFPPSQTIFWQGKFDLK